MSAGLLLIAGAGLQAASTVQQGRIQAAQGKTAQRVNEYNAKQLDRQAKAKMDAAKINADRISRKEKMVQAANIAKAAKSGISLGESQSTIDVLADTAFQFYMDRNFTMMQGLSDKISLEAQASLLRAEGAFAKDMGNQAKKLSYVQAGAEFGLGLGMAGMSSTAPASTMSSQQAFTTSSSSFSQPLSSYGGSTFNPTPSNLFRAGGL